jgi:hypothetical protein
MSTINVAEFRKNVDGMVEHTRQVLQNVVSLGALAYTGGDPPLVAQRVAGAPPCRAVRKTDVELALDAR